MDEQIINKMPQLQVCKIEKRVDYRAFKNFDAVLIHPEQTQLINKCKIINNSAFEFDRAELQYKGIQSPVMVEMTINIAIALEEHIKQCKLSSIYNGLLSLIDYMPQQLRLENSSDSSKEFLSEQVAFQLPEGRSHAAKTPDFDRIASLLSQNQIIKKDNQRKLLRYFDPHVLIHLIVLNYSAYVAQRYAYPQRLWLQIEKSWYDIDGLHHYHFKSQMRSPLVNFCPIKTSQLENISLINCFFAHYNLPSFDLIINNYSLLSQWIEEIKLRLASTDLYANNADRKIVVNEWLYEKYKYYQQFN